MDINNIKKKGSRQMDHFGNAKNNLLGTKEEENKYYDENIVIDSKDKNDSHALLASLVNENSMCLDVGCSVGYIGELLKKEKHCTIYGIEIDKEAIKMAEKKKCYKSIYTFSITNESSKNYQDFFSNSLKFDCILFADILEHVEDPYKIIYNFSKKLKRNGRILISLPNIAHMDISKNLINRKFNYNKTGLLDTTHIRFFTKNSFIDMINNINFQYHTNLQIEQVLSTTVVPSYINQYPNLYKILNQDNELCVLQYIYEITINSEPKKRRKRELNFFEEIEKNISERNIFFKKIQEQESLINKQEQQVIKQTNQINNLENLLEEKNKEIKNYQESATNYQNELEHILNSKSWKLTKPLRFIKNKIHKK